MLHRTIFIGLGSTGCNVIDAIQDIAYLSTGAADMGGAWAYLKLDTAGEKDTTFCGDKGQFISLGVGESQITNLKTRMESLEQTADFNREKLKWLWDGRNLRISAKQAGAGLNRRYGRGSVYYFWEVEPLIKNWLVKKKTEFMAPASPNSPQQIEEKLARILPEGSPKIKVSNNPDDPFKIIIVTSLAGGTGSGALLQLASQIYESDISKKDIACLALIPSIDHPITTDILSNNKRYSSMESLKYYENYMAHSESPQNLRPLLIASPSNGSYTLDAADDEAVSQLEYLGAMFITRMNAAMDWDAIAVDLMSSFPKQPHPWTFSLSGVRIPALEMKALKIYEAIKDICDPAQSNLSINWSSGISIARETLSSNAQKITSEAFRIMQKNISSRLEGLPSIHKRDFQQQFSDKKLNWFPEDDEALISDIIGHIMNVIRVDMHTNPGLRSVQYIKNLMEGSQRIINQMTDLSEGSLVNSYSLLRGDPPSEISIHRLFTWYMKPIFKKVIDRIIEKTNKFEEALKSVQVNSDVINRIKKRKNSLFYHNVDAPGFNIVVPRLSFLDMAPVYDLFTKPNQDVHGDKLKNEILSELSRVVTIPPSNSFDRTQFTKEQAKNYMKDKLEPMLNLIHNEGMTPALRNCFGGALTELIGDDRREERLAFEERIKGLDLEVRTGVRIDADLTRLMSPLQLDAIKIWIPCKTNQLAIGKPEMQTCSAEIAHSDLQANYWIDPNQENESLAVDALRCLIAATQCQIFPNKQIIVTGVEPGMNPTGWSNNNRDYGISLLPEHPPLLFFTLDPKDTLDTVLQKFYTELSHNKKIVTSWIDSVRNKPALFATLPGKVINAELKVTLPSGGSTRLL